MESLFGDFQGGEQQRGGYGHRKGSSSRCVCTATCTEVTSVSHICPTTYRPVLSLALSYPALEDMSSPTDLHLPPSLPYPIKVASLDVKQGAYVQRGARLLSYSFKYQSSTPGARPELRFGTWDSLLEGTVEAWTVRVGDEIPLQRSKQKSVITILEPCKHGVQVGGLCGICGKDMTAWVASLSSTAPGFHPPLPAMTTQASLIHRVHLSK